MTTTVPTSQSNDSQIVVHNSLILLSRRVAFWGFNAIIVLFLPRYLGAEGLGQLAFAQSFAALFTTVLSLGFGQYLIKEVARNRDILGTHLGAAIALRLITSVIVAGITVGFILVTGYSGDAQSVMFIAVAIMITTSFVHLTTAVLVGLEDVGWLSIAEIVSRLFVVTAGVFVLVQGYGLVAYAAVLLVAAFMNLGMDVGYLSRRVRIGVNFELPKFKTLIVSGAPFIMMAFLLDIYNQTDTVVLRVLTGEATVGWYAAANQIYKTFSLLPLAFTEALLPTLSRMRLGAFEASIAMARKAIVIGALGILPLALGISLFADQIIATLPYPDEFTNTIPLLTILALTVPFTASLMVLGTIAVAVDRQKAWSLGLLATVIFNVIGNLIAAPYFHSHFGNGGIGVALTTLLSEAIMLGIGIWLMPRGVFDRVLNWTLLKIGVSGGLMVVSVLAARSFGLPVAAQVGVGALTYIVLALRVKAVTREDTRFITDILVSKLSFGRFSKP